MTYQWHFQVVWQNLPFLLQGLGMTVAATVLSMLVGLVGGLLIALMRLSAWRGFRMPAIAFTEAFRTTPLLVQIVWVYTVLPLSTGIMLSPFTSGLVALGLNVAAFMSEIYRAGITSVSPFQTQAGLALGMTRWQVLRRVVLPQAVRRVIPPTASMWVGLFKDTSLLAAIGVAEVMYQARVIAAETFRPLEIFTATALIYFLLTYPQSLAVNRLFKRLRVQE
ncbi:MAG TPA: amino acid ABC transporter permease [Candidatus Baltobacteraceae bacterium]|nr:amino acid ABC transporter permease [Candidatus Baltobacteraceae bacterium]